MDLTNEKVNVTGSFSKVELLKYTRVLTDRVIIRRRRTFLSKLKKEQNKAFLCKTVKKNNIEKEEITQFAFEIILTD